MADFTAPIKPKKSSTASEVPQASDLEVAEIAINTADGLMWTKHTDNSIVQIGGGGGSTTLDGLTDTTITSPTNGQVLKYNGSAWINDTDATGGGSLQTASDFSYSQSATGDTISGYYDIEILGRAEYTNPNYPGSGNPTYTVTYSPTDDGQWTGYPLLDAVDTGAVTFKIHKFDRDGVDHSSTFAAIAASPSSYTLAVIVDGTAYGPTTLNSATNNTTYLTVDVQKIQIDASKFNNGGYTEESMPFNPSVADRTRYKTIQFVISTSGNSGTNNLSLVEGDVMVWNGIDKFVARQPIWSIDQHSDVNTTTVTPNANDLLHYQNGQWVPVAPTQLTTTVSPLVGTSRDTYLYGDADLQDIYLNERTFLLRANGNPGSTSFLDTSKTFKQGTAAGTTIQNSLDYSYTGNGSIEVYDGYITFTNDSTYDLADEDFTIEFFVYRNADDVGGTVFMYGDDHSTGTDFGWAVNLSTTDTLRIAYTTDGVGLGAISEGAANNWSHTWDTNTQAANTWSHYAICRQGKMIRAWQDGVLLDIAVGGESIDATIFSPVTADLKVFKSVQGGADVALCNAYYDGLRITKGVARYHGKKFKPVDYEFGYTKPDHIPYDGQVLAWSDKLSSWQPTTVPKVKDIPFLTASPTIPTVITSAMDADGSNTASFGLAYAATPTEGDLMVIFIANDDSNGVNNADIVPPAGWTLYRDEPVSYIVGSSLTRYFWIYTKVAEAAESNSYIFTQNPAGNSVQISGVTIRNTTGVDAIIERRGSGTLAAVETFWQGASTAGGTTQTGASVTQVTDPGSNQRMSLGYTSTAGEVLSTTSSTFADGNSDPNHRILNIQFKGPFNLNPCPVYADETAATSGGLSTGDVYRTSTGELRIKL